MSRRKILKIKCELDFLGIKIHLSSIKRHLSSFQIYDLNLQAQQLKGDILSLKLEMKREAEQPFVSNEVDQSHEDNKVDLDLLPIFDDYGKEEKEEEQVLGRFKKRCGS